MCRRLNRGVDARARLVEAQINRGLAYQMRAMREARKWSQGDLAARVDMPQTAISRLESPSYGKPTITTLKRIARVYDVALDVRFVPFSQLIDRLSGTPRFDTGLSTESFDVPSYEEESERGTFQDVRLVTMTPTAIVADKSKSIFNIPLEQIKVGKMDKVAWFGVDNKAYQSDLGWINKEFLRELVNVPTIPAVSQPTVIIDIPKKSSQPVFGDIYNGMVAVQIPQEEVAYGR